MLLFSNYALFMFQVWEEVSSISALRFELEGDILMVNCRTKFHKNPFLTFLTLAWL